MTSSRTPLFFITLACVVMLAAGHGYLVQPPPRFVDSSVRNLPLTVPWGSNEVCKDRPAESPTVTLTVGQTTTVQWEFTANHVGDCFMYLSYDNGATFFKIAQWDHCNQHNNVPQQMMIPSYLPSCTHCILRYEWYALHVWPKIELYVDCVDVVIVGSANGRLPTPAVVIPGHLPLDGGTQTNPLYRNEYDPTIPFFFTGPPVATVSGSGTTPTPTSTSTPTPTTHSSSTGGSRPTTPTTSTRSSTGASRPAPPTHGSTATSGSTTGVVADGSQEVSIIIKQLYRIAYAQYQTAIAYYNRAFINALANSARPPLDATRMDILQVTPYDATRLKVTFVYQPDSYALVSTVQDVSLAIAAGRADNSSETMEVDENVPPEVGLGSTVPATAGPSTLSNHMEAITAAVGVAVFCVLGFGIGYCVHRRRQQSKEAQAGCARQPVAVVVDGAMSPTGSSTTTALSPASKQ